MKKTLFALEVLLMLSALPLFCGLAMGRENHATEKVQDASSSITGRQNADAMVLQPQDTKNS